MNHSQLVERVAGETGTPIAVVAQVLTATAEAVHAAIDGGEKVQLAGIGTVETTVRRQRTGRNPRTGEAIVIPEHTSVKVTPAAALKRAGR